MAQDLVFIASASDQTEAGALRAYLEAHGVHAYLQGEHHSSLFGPLGALAIELRILVPESEAETAREVVESFYASEPLEEDADVSELEAEIDPSEPASEESEETRDSSLIPAGSEAAIATPGRAATLALIPGFGLGHLVTGATGRGLALMIAEALGIAWILAGEVASGLTVAVLAVAVDFLGATTRARDHARGRVPDARLHSGSPGSGGHERDRAESDSENARNPEG